MHKITKLILGRAVVFVLSESFTRAQPFMPTVESAWRQEMTVLPAGEHLHPERYCYEPLVDAVRSAVMQSGSMATPHHSVVVS